VFCEIESNFKSVQFFLIHPVVNIVPYDCESSPGGCFFVSSGHGLYKNLNCHLDIRSAGITHLMHNPELYNIEDRPITRRRADMTFIFEW
jgi:hypothetical protein